MTKFIALASGKGGTGKTTIAINLALALNSLGRDVTLVDANTVAPNIGLHLGFPELKTTLQEVLEGKKDIREALYLHPSGLKVIPGSTTFKKSEFNKELNDVLLGLIGKTEIVVIDVGKEMLEALKAADETIIVTNPDHLALTDASKIISLAEDAGSVVVGIVLNRADKKQKLKALLNESVIAAIPEDRKIAKSIAIKQPIVLSYPNSASSKEIKKLAELLSH